MGGELSETIFVVVESRRHLQQLQKNVGKKLQDPKLQDPKTDTDASMKARYQKLLGDIDGFTKFTNKLGSPHAAVPPSEIIYWESWISRTFPPTKVIFPTILSVR